MVGGCLSHLLKLCTARRPAARQDDHHRPRIGQRRKGAQQSAGPQHLVIRVAEDEKNGLWPRRHGAGYRRSSASGGLGALNPSLASRRRAASSGPYSTLRTGNATESDVCTFRYSNTPVALLGIMLLSAGSRGWSAKLMRLNRETFR